MLRVNMMALGFFLRGIGEDQATPIAGISRSAARQFLCSNSGVLRYLWLAETFAMALPRISQGAECHT